MRNYQTKKLVEMSLISSVIFLLTFTEIGYPKFGPINSTIIHLPVFFGILYFATLKESIILGSIFGFSSFLKVWIMPTGPLDVIFLNPFVSILPRILVSIIAYFLLVKINNKWMTYPLVFIVSLIHSLLVLSSMFIFYQGLLFEVLNTSVFWFLGSIFITSSMIEALMAMFFVPTMVRIIKKEKK